jgi:hypothetical protein
MNALFEEILRKKEGVELWLEVVGLVLRLSREGTVTKPRPLPKLLFSVDLESNTHPTRDYCKSHQNYVSCLPPGRCLFPQIQPDFHVTRLP